jgi:steroid 5-alpha reductase family enzyme
MTETHVTSGSGIAKSVMLCALAYVVAGSAALGVGYSLGGRHPLLVAGISDLAGTAVVFFFSVLFNNSSVYDPYWSVAPIPIALYFALQASPGSADTARLSVVLLLVCLWGGRLTYNWLRGWGGLTQEDWRYVNIRNRSGRLYWPASFIAIHLIPTLAVFLGCFSLYVSLSQGVNSFGTLDFIAAAVTSYAIWVEAQADRQLRRFKLTKRGTTDLLSTGLWAFTRHPNYFGEVLFWWGLFMFSVAASPDNWWAAAGPTAITLLFVFISIPMMEKHLGKKRPGYDIYRRMTPMLIPWFVRFRIKNDEKKNI